MNRTITVKGIGKLSLKPDQTVITLTLKNLNPVYDKAMDEAAGHLEQLRDAVTALGFSADELKTANFDVRTEYESKRDKSGNYRQIFAGYRVTHELKLEFGFDTRLLSRVLGAVAVCIADPELNIRFTVKDREAVGAALLESACRNARNKAEILTKASGVELGELVSVDYNWSELNIFSPTGYEMENMCMLKAGSAPPAINIQPDDISVSDSVTFVWEIK